MPGVRHYGPVEDYERKLKVVMERLKAELIDWDCTRRDAWVEFRYKGKVYRFEHSVDRAKERGINIHFGSDAFAQIVLALEDLARMVERGIYDLDTWVAGMLKLPAPGERASNSSSGSREVPECLRTLGFSSFPESASEIIDAFRRLIKHSHPDAGGSDEEADRIIDAYHKARELWDKGFGGGRA